MAESKPNKAEESPEKRISALRRERDEIRRMLQRGALTGIGRDPESQQAPPSRVEVQAAADRLNQALDSLNRDLAISVHEGSGLLVVKVTDPGTGEVVRQIPAEQVLEVQESIDKIVGLFVNDTA